MTLEKIRGGNTIGLKKVGIKDKFEKVYTKLVGTIDKIISSHIEQYPPIISKGTIPQIQNEERNFEKAGNLKRINGNSIKEIIGISNIVVGSNITQLVDINKKYIIIKLIYLGKVNGEKENISFTIGITPITLEGIIVEKNIGANNDEHIIKFCEFEAINKERQKKMLIKLSKAIDNVKIQ